MTQTQSLLDVSKLAFAYDGAAAVRAFRGGREVLARGPGPIAPPIAS